MSESIDPPIDLQEVDPAGPEPRPRHTDDNYPSSGDINAESHRAERSCDAVGHQLRE